MTVFSLKILAMASMVFDHLGFFLFVQQGLISYTAHLALRSFGRLAFPIFALLIVNGWQHSRDRLAYLRRLMLFALISQVPYTLVFSIPDAVFTAGLSIKLPSLLQILLCLFAGFVYHRFVRADSGALLCSLCLAAGLSTVKLGGLYLLRPDMNVFYTLAMALALMCAADMLIKKQKSGREAYATVLAVLAALILVMNRADYGINGILLLVALWFFRENRTQQLLMLLIWAFIHYSPGTSPVSYLICAALSAVPIWFYNNRPGKTLKTVFYLVYPLHLSVMGLILIWQAYV